MFSPISCEHQYVVLTNILLNFIPSGLGFKVARQDSIFRIQALTNHNTVFYYTVLYYHWYYTLTFDGNPMV